MVDMSAKFSTIILGRASGNLRWLSVKAVCPACGVGACYRRAASGSQESLARQSGG